jgi:pentapeptide MXKDX repeat protein
MKKALCMIALAAVSFGSVFAFAGNATVKTTHGIMQTDTTKKKMKKKKMKKDSTMKKDTMKMKK